MLKPLPKWLFVRYSKLWVAKKDQDFTFSDAQGILCEKDQKTLSVILSDLRKSGWLEASLGSQDSRRRTYRLVSPITAVEQIVKEDL